MRLVDLDEMALKKLALKIAESERAAACFINKHGNVVCAAGKSSGRSAKQLLDNVLSQLGGSGGGSERIAQGKTQRVAVVKL
jgi:alanyl-tRNA synthetase